MQTELTLLSAFLLGLFGSVHCVGMCGGIVGALTLGLSDTVRQSSWRMLPYLLSYNLGRIASYAVAGAALGWAGGALMDTLMQGQTRIIGGIVGTITTLVKHRERMAMIKQGIHPDHPPDEVDEDDETPAS